MSAREYPILHVCAGFRPERRRQACVTKEALCRADPDVRMCRIRLSDQDSCLRARAAARSSLEPEQPQVRVQVVVREA
jgi:hypothetical protein